MNAKVAETKMRSKKECFMFLKHDCKTYLPHHEDCVTTYFLKDLMTGEKKRRNERRLRLNINSSSER